MSEQGIEQLYDAHASMLFAFVLNLTRSEADTKDVLQQVFCNLAKEPERLGAIRDAKAYLARMAYRLVIDQHRRLAVRERHVEDVGNVEIFAPTVDPDEGEFRRSLNGALAGLPEEQRAVLHLKLWEGMTFDEVAGVLDILPNTAASRYRYGIDKIRAVLRPLYEEIQ